MFNKDVKIEKEKHSIVFFFDKGLKAVINYELEKDADDYVIERVKKSWENNEFLFSEVEFNELVKINGEYVSEIDMRKVVAVDYNPFYV